MKIKVILDDKLIRHVKMDEHALNIVELEVNGRESLGWLVYKIEELKSKKAFHPERNYFDHVELYHRSKIELTDDGLAITRYLSKPIKEFDFEKEDCFLQTHKYNCSYLHPIKDDIIKKEYDYFENYAEKKQQDLIGFCAFSSINNGYDYNGNPKQDVKLPKIVMHKIGTFFTVNNEQTLNIIDQAKQRASRLEQNHTQKKCILF